MYFKILVRSYAITGNESVFAMAGYSVFRPLDLHYEILFIYYYYYYFFFFASFFFYNSHYFVSN